MDVRPDGVLTIRDAAGVLGLSEIWTRTLVGQGVLASVLIGRRRYVPLDAINPFVQKRRADDLERVREAPQDWDWEGNLVRVIGDWHEQRDWSTTARAETALREHGIDLVLERAGRRRLVEVKGWPGATKRTGPNKGIAVRSRHAMGRNYLGDLVLSVMVLRAENVADQVALAVPSHRTFTTLLDKIRASLAKLDIGVIVVRENGTIESSLDGSEMS
jgi:hypothetical protein